MNMTMQRRTLGDFQLQLGEQSLTAQEMGALVSVRVQQCLSSPALAEIIFHSHSGFAVETLTAGVGAHLKISLQHQQYPLFSGQITAQEIVYGSGGQTLLHLRAYDHLHRLYRQQQVRVHVQTNIHALAQEWVASLGLRLEHHSAVALPNWQWKIQHQQTDGEWLTSLAHEQGYYLQAQAHSVHLLTLAGMGSVLPLTLGESLREARFTHNSLYQCSNVQVTGWDAASIRDIQAQTGFAMSEKHSARHLIDYPVSSQVQAERIAAAVLERCQSNEHSLWAIAEGNPELHPGRKICVHGVATSLFDTYTLTKVTHTADAYKGYIAELSTIPPVIPPLHQALPKAILGKVSNIDDPTHSGRIKVSLPTYHDTETDWLHVVQAAAGSNKGLVMLPACGDMVILLPLADDPAQAVVLGGVYGMGNLPASPVTGDKVTSYALHTPQGHYLRFDETRHETTLHNSSGSYIQFTPDSTCIHSTADLLLEAPGKTIVIRGNRIDLEKQG